VPGGSACHQKPNLRCQLRDGKGYHLRTSKLNPSVFVVAALPCRSRCSAKRLNFNSLAASRCAHRARARFGCPLPPLLPSISDFLNSWQCAGKTRFVDTLNRQPPGLRARRSVYGKGPRRAIVREGMDGSVGDGRHGAPAQERAASSRPRGCANSLTQDAGPTPSVLLVSPREALRRIAM
jgi:hypothetical protein